MADTPADPFAQPYNGVDPNLYRLWALPPLQWQALRGAEMILEVWTRHANSVRQTVARIVVRRDGKAFVQGRAGLACCEAGIARRVRFDAELPEGTPPGDVLTHWLASARATVAPTPAATKRKRMRNRIIDFIIRKRV